MQRNWVKPMIRKTTKELLAESFRELAEQKPINKITIANITDNCGMTQPTFYRYYKDEYDLIAWIYVTDSEKIMGQIGSNGYIWKDTLLDGARYFSENRAVALNALRHTSGRDAFLNLLETVNTELLSAEVRKVLMTEKLPDDILTMIKVYCYGTVRFTFEWLIEDMPLSHVAYAEIMERCLPEPLRPFLYPKQ